VIRSFKSKGLAELWEKGRTGKIDANMQARILRRLDRLDVIVRPEEMNVLGFNFHPLRGFKPTRYSVHVNGPWCITFEFEDGDVCRAAHFPGQAGQRYDAAASFAKLDGGAGGKLAKRGFQFGGERHAGSINELNYYL